MIWKPRDGMEMMGVAFENNLAALFWVLLVLAAIGGLGMALWKPVGRRAWRYFVCWWQRDQMREREARAEIAARRRAEREVEADCFGNDATAPPTDLSHVAPPATMPQAETAPAATPAPSRTEEPVCEPAAAASARLYSRN